ncbi:MAG: hypothetical protein GY820_08265 [Gammaproteobacteria bacterium]|nr:hypothetical protein [Gammaproteobacteria bacterium]
MRHTVELEEYHTAKLGGLEYKSKTGGVIGPVLRKAMKEGIVSEGDTVRVMRGDTLCFSDVPVEAFTSYNIKEDDKGLRRIKYVPYENPHYKQES